MAYPYYAYNPYYPATYQPATQPQPAQSSPPTGIIWISGIQEAQMYSVAPNYAVALWERYLRYLARGISNIRMLIDCEFIIGGHLGQYLSEEDFARLRALVDEECPLRLGGAVISPSRFRSESAAKGAALPAIKAFLQTV